jgi:hypothetical protein
MIFFFQCQIFLFIRLDRLRFKLRQHTSNCSVLYHISLKVLVFSDINLVSRGTNNIADASLLLLYEYIIDDSVNC